MRRRNTQTPRVQRSMEAKMGYGAPGRIRTRDPLITNQVLYQLSYKGTSRRVTTTTAAVKEFVAYRFS
jgi:hypothetical protein